MKHSSPSSATKSIVGSQSQNIEHQSFTTGLFTRKSGFNGCDYYKNAYTQYNDGSTTEIDQQTNRYSNFNKKSSFFKQNEIDMFSQIDKNKICEDNEALNNIENKSAASLSNVNSRLSAKASPDFKGYYTKPNIVESKQKAKSKINDQEKKAKMLDLKIKGSQTVNVNIHKQNQIKNQTNPTVLYLTP